MIDICIVLHKNYDLLDLQLMHWNWIAGEHRLLFCDNTPDYMKRDLTSYNINLIHAKHWGIDGESHGSALDLLLKQSESKIVGICDSDFFWTKKNLLDEVKYLFELGCQCVGVELWYDDWEKVNAMYPERAGYLAPCVFGMFVDRELALSETFVVTAEEGSRYHETGWRLRKKIIDEKIPCCVYRAYQYPDQPDKKTVFFGKPEEVQGVHFLKCSNEYFGRDGKKLFYQFALDKVFQQT